MNVLAIDQGTSATKAVVVSDDHTVLAEAEVPVHPHATPDGGVEQDPEQLWTSVVEAGRTAIERAGCEVDAVGLDNQGETILAWGRTTGEPVSGAISWQDGRAVDVCERLAPHADELTSITGLPLDPYFSAPKIVWLREHVTTDGVVTTTDAWLLHRLCGAYVTDTSTASRTLLLDLATGEWSPRACELFDVDPEYLPAVAPCAGVVGETSVFGGSVPVSGIVVDQQAALFAQGCHALGESKCTYGTGAFLQANAGPSAPTSRAGSVACIAWKLRDVIDYLLEGQVYTVGSAVSWLQEVGVLREPRELDEIGARVVGPEGASFVPGLAGHAAPFWRPGARGAFTGLSLGTTRAHLIRSVIEGIAAGVAWVAMTVGDDLGTGLRVLRVDGGLTRSRLLMQTQADLLQTPVEVYPSPNATVLGTSAFARLGMGGARDAAEATGEWIPAATFEPAISSDEARERLGRWRAAVEATMDLDG